MNRLEKLAREFGANTGTNADWKEPLLKAARSEFYSRTKEGNRSYGAQHGMDIITAGEIVSQVYVRWASKPEISVEWFDSLEGPNATAKMLNTYCKHAADDVLEANIQYRRIEGVSVVPMAMAEQSAMDDGDDDGDGWILNMPAMTAKGADEDYFEQEGNHLFEQFVEGCEIIVHSILDAVDNDAYRTALRASVLDGMLNKDIEAKYGIGAKTAASAYRRGVKDDGDIACLKVWRNMDRGMQEGTATKAALAAVCPPTKFLILAEAMGIDTDEVTERFAA